MKRVAIYLRVSTTQQTTANQERELREIAERAGWQIVKVYKDHGIFRGPKAATVVRLSMLFARPSPGASAI